MPPSSSSVTEEQSIPTGRFKPLVSLLNHKWLALFLFTVVSGLGGVVFLQLKETPLYKAQAVLLVSPRFTPNLDTERGMDLGHSQYPMYIKQQEGMITRRDVLQETLQIPEVRKVWLLPGEEPEIEARIRLKNALSVETKRGDPLMTVALTSEKATGLDLVLNTLVDIYLKKSKEENLFDTHGRLEKLEQRQKELERFISEQRKRRTQIALELGVTTFQEDNLIPYDDILIESAKAQTLAHRQRIEAETRLEALNKKQDHERTTLDILVDEMVANDSVLKSFKTKLTDRRTELLTQMLGLTPQHPSRRRAEQEIAKIDRDIEQATQELSKEIRNRLLAKNQADISQVQSIEQALSNELETQREQAKRYTTLYNDALELNKEIDRAEKQLDKISDRIDFLTLESDAPGFVRLYTAAVEPSQPTESKLRKLILIALVVAALGLGIGVPILIDLLDRRLRTPGEVHKILGFAPMAWVLDRYDYRTDQLATDYLRRMALALERDWHTHETNCFVLTSVKPGGGTTTLTLELAHLLSELGVRTLALELNAFKPDGRYRGATPYNSLMTLLNQEPPFRSPEALIIPATGDLPDRLPVGETPTRHLATQGRLRPLLKQLTAHYDLILLDTPPILLSADAELLGEVAGGVLLVIEAEVILPGELRRATQLLERLNPPVVGAILNRVKIYQGGGYFADLLKEYETAAKLRPGWLKRLLFH